jgi:hypothetical protein
MTDYVERMIGLQSEGIEVKSGHKLLTSLKYKSHFPTKNQLMNVKVTSILLCLECDKNCTISIKIKLYRYFFEHE